MEVEPEDRPKPLGYRTAWDRNEPPPRDLIGGASRLITCAIVTLAGAVLWSGAASGSFAERAATCQTWGTILFSVGLMGLLIEYWFSLRG